MRWFRNALITIAAVVSSWLFAAFFASNFTCYPVQKTWDSSIPGTCISFGTVTLVLGIFNVILDFVVLGTPMPCLWKLQMSTSRKFLLSCAFATGSVACVVSIARLFYAHNASLASTAVAQSDGDHLSLYDPSWDNVWPAVLSGLEISTGIVACCTITYRPLVEKLLGLCLVTKSTERNHRRRGHRSKSKIERSATVAYQC
ncbi:hypothetical protein F5Y12DRAFT_774757 [Xylaria sp. FL1777]|nr:hypothetical protein F5Y12DRAFT_774757 [Xylaria sp. FL1777]